MNGKKKVEVRKENVRKAVQKLIDKYGFADIYAYCTKGNEDIVRVSSPYSSVPNYTCVKIDKKLSKDLPEYEFSSRGKVIFKFRCYKVEEIKFTQTEWYGTKETPALQVLDKSCLSAGEIMIYLKDKNGKGRAIHISELEIFDKPKELSEFGKYGFDYIGYTKEKSKVGRCFGKDNYLLNKHVKFIPLTKAPQSFCYIEVLE